MRVRTRWRWIGALGAVGLAAAAWWPPLLTQGPGVGVTDAALLVLVLIHFVITSANTDVISSRVSKCQSHDFGEVILFVKHLSLIGEFGRF